VTGGILGFAVIVGVSVYVRNIYKNRRRNATVNVPDIRLEDLSVTTSSSEEIYQIPVTRSRAIKEL
jgi:hypothetical protein